MWGEVIEEENYDASEEFYNHDKAMNELKRRNQMESKRKRLKKKIVYVYESDSSDE